MNRQAATLIRLLSIICMFFTGSLAAQPLPSMSKAPWIGFFSGYERRGFEFGINNEGQSELYLMGKKTKKRVGAKRTIKIYTEVLVELDDGKTFTKRLKQDEGFSTATKPSMDNKEVKFTAESSGGAKVEVSVKYDRDRIIMDGRILDRGTLKKGKIYLQFKVKVPPMYGKSYNNADKKKLKSVMRKDLLRFTRAEDKKRVSLKTYEVVDLQDKAMAKGGVTEIIVKMKGLEGQDLIFSTENTTGVISLENKAKGGKSPFWKGYYVKWKREFTEAAEGGKGISPFVIELK